MLEPHDIFRMIDSESSAAAATITATSLAARVPSCPEWSLAELIWHLGRVQRFWAVTARSGGADPVRPAEEPIPTRAEDLEAWFRESTRELLGALHEVDWAEPAWTWWKEDRTVGAIARHQVQEAAVHRWDAELAGGKPAPLPVTLADDGVAEFLWIAGQMRGPAPIAFRATDTGNTYAAGPGRAVATVSGPASDLVLLLYGRVLADDLRVTGDRVALDAFLVPII